MIRPEITRLSTHVLDTTAGRPAGGLPASLEQIDPDGSAWAAGTGVTDADGRIHRLNAAALEPGEYRLSLTTREYFGTVFYPVISVQFVLSGEREHYHIAVLASTYSYTTYLGS